MIKIQTQKPSKCSECLLINSDNIIVAEIQKLEYLTMFVIAFVICNTTKAWEKPAHTGQFVVSQRQSPQLGKPCQGMLMNWFDQVVVQFNPRYTLQTYNQQDIGWHVFVTWETRSNDCTSMTCSNFISFFHKPWNEFFSILLIWLWLKIKWWQTLRFIKMLLGTDLMRLFLKSSHVIWGLRLTGMSVKFCPICDSGKAKFIWKYWQISTICSILFPAYNVFLLLAVLSEEASVKICFSLIFRWNVCWGVDKWKLVYLWINKSEQNICCS